MMTDRYKALCQEAWEEVKQAQSCSRERLLCEGDVLQAVSDHLSAYLASSDHQYTETEVHGGGVPNSYGYRAQASYVTLVDGEVYFAGRRKAKSGSWGVGPASDTWIIPWHKGRHRAYRVRER